MPKPKISISLYAIPGLLDIDRVVSDVWGVDVELLKQRTRKREIVEARQVAMWYLHKKKGLSQARAGAIYGGYDHATVSHACKTVKNLRATNTLYRHRTDEVLKAMDVEELFKNQNS